MAVFICHAREGITSETNIYSRLANYSEIGRVEKGVETSKTGSTKPRINYEIQIQNSRYLLFAHRMSNVLIRSSFGIKHDKKRMLNLVCVFVLCNHSERDGGDGLWQHL